MAENNLMSIVLASPEHPGETLTEYMEFNGWSQRDLSRRTGLTPKTISEICNGKAPISPTTALALEKVLGRPAHLWLNLQRQFDEAQARKKVSESTSELVEWAKTFPIAEMKKFHWLEGIGGRESLEGSAEHLLRFFGVSSPASWRNVWNAANVAYRQTRSTPTKSTEAISAWVRATELAAADVRTAEFDEARLGAILGELRAQTREPAERFIPVVQDLCATAGVAVVWVPELKHTGISGCARWLTDKKALVALTLRYKADDQVWFTFFHELGHILLHRRKSTFILDNAEDNLFDNTIDPQMQRNEEEANRFAADLLIPPMHLYEFTKQQTYSNEAIHEFANALGIGPGIVVGRLQKEGILQYHQGNALKRTFHWNITN